MQYVAAAMAVISAISSITGGIMGSQAANKAARAESRAEGVVTAAKLADLAIEERALKGQTLAATAGSRVKVGVGSAVEILKEQAATFARERLTVATVGATKASIITKRGKMVGDQALFQGIGQGFSSASTAFSLFAKA